MRWQGWPDGGKGGRGGRGENEIVDAHRAHFCQRPHWRRGGRVAVEGGGTGAGIGDGSNAAEGVVGVGFGEERVALRVLRRDLGEEVAGGGANFLSAVGLSCGDGRITRDVSNGFDGSGDAAE